MNSWKSEQKKNLLKAFLEANKNVRQQSQDLEWQHRITWFQPATNQATVGKPIHAEIHKGALSNTTWAGLKKD